MSVSRTDFLEFGATLKKSQLLTKANIQSEWMVGFGKFVDVHEFLLSCLACSLSYPSKRFDDSHPVTVRASIHASYIRGIDAVKYCLATGSYPQAACLIRQEIEAIEACRGIREGKQKDKETPRIKALKHLGAIYGQLTGLSHLSDFALTLEASGLMDKGVDHFHHPRLSRFLFGVHTTTMLFMALDIDELHPTTDPNIDRHRRWFLEVSAGILSEEGLLASRPKGSA